MTPALMDGKVIETSGYLPVVHIHDDLALPTYFLIISLACCLCIFTLVKRVERKGLNRNQALDLSLVVMVAGLLGSRLFHVFLEEPKYYAQSPARVLEIWNGGFVWYGGALFGAVAGILFARWRKMSLPLWLDISAPIAALGYGIGRIGCLLAGCCYGEICVLSSGARFRYPTQAFAILWELALVAGLLAVEKRGLPKWFRWPGGLFVLWLILHATGRVAMEMFRADPRGPMALGLSPSTWLSLALLASSTFIVYRQRSQAK